MLARAIELRAGCSELEIGIAVDIHGIGAIRVLQLLIIDIIADKIIEQVQGGDT